MGFSKLQYGRSQVGDVDVSNIKCGYATNVSQRVLKTTESLAMSGSTVTFGQVHDVVYWKTHHECQVQRFNQLKAYVEEGEELGAWLAMQGRFNGVVFLFRDCQSMILWFIPSLYLLNFSLNIYLILTPYMDYLILILILLYNV